MSSLYKGQNFHFVVLLLIVTLDAQKKSLSYAHSISLPFRVQENVCGNQSKNRAIKTPEAKCILKYTLLLEKAYNWKVLTNAIIVQ